VSLFAYNGEKQELTKVSVSGGEITATWKSDPIKFKISSDPKFKIGEGTGAVKIYGAGDNIMISRAHEGHDTSFAYIYHDREWWRLIVDTKGSTFDGLRRRAKEVFDVLLDEINAQCQRNYQACYGYYLDDTGVNLLRVFTKEDMKRVKEKRDTETTPIHRDIPDADKKKMELLAGAALYTMDVITTFLYEEYKEFCKSSHSLGCTELRRVIARDYFWDKENGYGKKYDKDEVKALYEACAHVDSEGLSSSRRLSEEDFGIDLDDMISPEGRFLA
jgi:hypothetical protein